MCIRDRRYNDAVMDLGNLTQEVNYEDVLPNTDLEYIVSPGEIKENIVVNTPQENYSYNFDLNIEGLIPIQIDEHKIGLYEENIGYNKEQILEQYSTWESYDWFNSMLDSEYENSLEPKNPFKYIVAAEFMSDANLDGSSNVSITLNEDENGRYSVTITADAQWINAQEREFPVKIDPTIRTGKTKNEYAGTYVIENRPNEVIGGSATLKAGYSTTYGRYRTYLRYVMPDLKASAQVVQATLMMNEYGGPNNGRWRCV